MPVIVHSRAHLSGVSLTARVEDEAEAEHANNEQHSRENSAALEAHFLGLALLCETSNFLCGITFCHGF